MAEQRRGAVVAQSAGVDSGRDEIVAQGVHLDERRQLGGVAEIVREAPLGEAGAGAGLHGQDARAFAGKLVEDVGQGQAAEVAAAAEAADHHVGLFARLLPSGAWLPGR